MWDTREAVSDHARIGKELIVYFKAVIVQQNDQFLFHGLDVGDRSITVRKPTFHSDGLHGQNHSSKVVRCLCPS